MFFAKGRGGIVFAEIRANGSVESHPSPFVTTGKSCGKDDEDLGLSNGPWAKLGPMED